MFFIECGNDTGIRIVLLNKQEITPGSETDDRLCSIFVREESPNSTGYGASEIEGIESCHNSGCLNWDGAR